MNYKIYFYVFFVLLSIFALSGLNFEKIFKVKKVWEARVFIILISLSLGFTVANCILIFLGLE